MIIIPELSTVLILTPRTGSGSLRRALSAKYPRSMLLYRHMEADGVPAGYDRWSRLGAVRDPLDRLWSLYKFLRRFDGDHDPAYIEAMRRQVDRPFEDWLLHNETPFTTPYDSAGQGRYWPAFTVRHPLPENRKSQFLYLRPDLGTEVYRFEDQFHLLARHLGVEREVIGNYPHNGTTAEPRPPLSPTAWKYAQQMFAWDFEATTRPEAAA